MHDDEEQTQAVQGELSTPVHPYLELNVLGPDGSQETLHFFHTEQPLAMLPEPFQWNARAEERSVVFSGSPAAQVGERAVERAELQPGECLEVAGWRIWVSDARLPALATLEGTSEDYAGRSWSLRPQPYRVGRRSQSRVNHIELNHPTVSRAHASLFPGTHNQVMLLPETDSSPTLVNGRSLDKGELTTLHHGDLLQFGELTMRFKQTGSESAQGKLLSIQSLGGFEVRWGDLSLSEGQWKSEKARWLLARLAWEWGKPLSTEQIMELLWPELPTLRGRKNLSQTLTNLRQALHIENDADDFLLRTPSTLQLNPQFLGEHDAVQIEALCQASEPLAWERALRLYQGEYLPTCFDDWAILVRQRLHDAILETATRLSAHSLEQKDWNAAIQSGQQGLVWDGCHQELALLVMEACLQSGQAPAAVRCFQQVSKQLKQQLELEPSIELLKAYHRAKLEMP